MRANRPLEIGTGLFVLLGLTALLFLTTQLPSSGVKIGGTKGYHVSAAFDNIGDLRVGAPVSISGVNIGEVQSIGFDPKTYKAVVTMSLSKKYSEIPEDSFASIQTQGLLGGKYIALSPGGEEAYLKEGSQIEQTQSAIVLESLINKFFANFASGGSSKSSTSSSSEESK